MNGVKEIATPQANPAATEYGVPFNCFKRTKIFLLYLLKYFFIFSNIRSVIVWRELRNL